MRPILACFLTLALTAPAAADSIHLRRSVRVSTDSGEVRLADVARLDGPRATALADVVVATLADPGRVTELTVDQVRARLDEAGVHWGIVNLSGRAVTLRPSSRNGAAAPSAMAGQSLAPTPTRRERTPDAFDVEAAAVVNQSTRLGVITRLALKTLARQATEVRFVFDAEDRPFLEEPVVPADVDVTFLSSVHSDRVNIAVRLWSGGILSPTTRVTCRPKLLTEVATARHPLERGTPLGSGDVDLETVWLPPSQASTMAAPGDLAGQLTARAIPAGEMIHRRHVKPATVIERGDRVVVRCRVVGGVITLQAEALANGAIGDSIELRKLGERITVMARVIGPGEAAIDIAR